MQKAGILIIFNKDEFESNESIVTRRKDILLLEETFQRFNAEIHGVYHNLSLDEIKAKMRIIERKDYGKLKYFVLVALGYDDNKNITDLLLVYPVLRNTTLINTPKLFVISAPSGEYDLLTLRTDATRFYDKIVTSNVLRFFATSKDYKIFDTVENGSIFILVFCMMLQQYGETMSIENIMRKTISLVYERTNHKQQPSYFSTFNEDDSEIFILGLLK